MYRVAEIIRCFNKPENANFSQAAKSVLKKVIGGLSALMARRTRRRTIEALDGLLAGLDTLGRNK